MRPTDPPFNPANPLTPASDADDSAPLKLDPERYRGHLESFDLSIDQQNELLEVLWNIMTTLVDIGWGVDTVQMLLPELFEKAGADSDKLLQVDDPETYSAARGQPKGKDNADE